MTSTYPPVTGSGKTTTYVPMITPFTASKECSSYFYGYVAENSSVTELFAWWTTFNVSNTNEPKCFPDAVTSVQFGEASQETTMTGLKAHDDYGTFFRLAPFTCPGGWIAVSSGTDSTASTTACCPR